MSVVWDASTPIYRQIQQNVMAQILDGVLRPNDPLLSVRQVATEMGVNPLTVTHAYHELVNDGVVIKKRGVGMFVSPNAFDVLKAQEKKKFLQEEWPQVLERIKRLGLDVESLLKNKTP